MKTYGKEPVEKQLSKTLLKMKFMQTTRIQLEKIKRKKRLEQEFKSTDIEQTKNSKMLKFEDNWATLEDLRFSRMSFKGFNPEVEKLMKYYDDLKNGLTPKDDFEIKDIQDKEMADILGRSDPLAKKFVNKRKRKLQND